jgi:hypothetical protein
MPRLPRPLPRPARAAQPPHAALPQPPVARHRPRRQSPNKPCSLAKLRELGVLYWRLDADSHESDPRLAAIRKVRNYSYTVGRPLGAAGGSVGPLGAGGAARAARRRGRPGWPAMQLVPASGALT